MNDESSAAIELIEQHSKSHENQGSTAPSGAEPLASSGNPEEAAEPRSLVRRITGIARRPKVRVWLMPLTRGLGTLGILSSVAFLGAQSKESDKYGEKIELGERPSALVTPGAETPADQLTPIEAPVLAQASSAPSPCAKAEQEAPRSSGLTEDGKIVMNEASKTEFTQLPGVGDSRAEAIVQLRTRMGKFRKVSDLLRVRGIGWKTLQTMKDKLIVDRPPAETKEEAEVPNDEKAAGSKNGATQPRLAARTTPPS